MPDALLSGITVIEMSEGVAGPSTALQLADMGADVVKVERRAGDWQRATGTTRVGNVGSAPFVALNRNKRNLGLDVTTEGGRTIIERLIARADVMVSNFRPGVMETLGLGAGRCRAINDGLVYCTISGFGQDGPYSRWPASDTVVQAASGMMQMVGEADGPPLRVGFPLIDMTAANHAVQAILLALYGRLKGRHGATIDVSLMAAALSLMSAGVTEQLITGKHPRRQGNQNVSLSPAGAYPVADGRYLTIAVLRDEHWGRFCAALGLEPLIDDPRFATNKQRLVNRAALDAIIAPLLAARSCEHWLERLRAADVLCAPINTFAEIVGDANFAAMLPLVDPLLPGVPRVMGTPIRYDGAFFDTRLPPPAKGQNTREVLGELGFGAADIEGFLGSGAAFEATEAV